MPNFPDLPDPAFLDQSFRYKRLETRSVQIGGLSLGGDAPIRLQSMTTVETSNVPGTIAESVRMIEAGCEIVRATAPSKREAACLEDIRSGLDALGHANIPLVADIHFTPNAAELAADFVEKIRVNPGNYADKKRFEAHNYTDEAYAAELERIRERFTPLVLKCKGLGRAIRIGTNHGSLSDRILSRYGDTPEGMVESALEFLRICQDEDYHDIVLSMKASNPQVMVQAYRLLVVRMRQDGSVYPLHLGVTEAGEGEDGRIKSAVGIGTLLEDGIGDTVRVSLTEAPEAEIPVARALVQRYENRAGHAPIPDAPWSIDPLQYQRRLTRAVDKVGSRNVPVVVHDLRHTQLTPAALWGCGHRYAPGLDKWHAEDAACDAIYIGAESVPFELPGFLIALQDAEHWTGRAQHHPLWTLDDFLKTSTTAGQLDPISNWVQLDADRLTDEQIDQLQAAPNVVALLSTDNLHATASLRSAFLRCIDRGAQFPIVIQRIYGDLTPENTQLYAATDCGALLLDGLGDGLWIEGAGGLQHLNRTAFGILQATRTRISQAEYISCPSCGRTLFDLQETTAKIRKVTDHLKGVKIGIMGCIVNGPGEMADADYGYVGTGPGKITLYKGREVVERNVPEGQAVDALIRLIRQQGDWVERATALE
jgi:(E)-4-hydroxy-3-methylbut-2-enyl-diphosphate synthase